MADETEGDGGTSATVVDAPRRAKRPTAAELTPGTRLEHFQILEPLGRGGMGSVYSAYDLRLDRKVAIKVLARDAAGPDLEQRRQRMLREAQMMAKLSHPNVVPVYEVGVDRDTIFIAMEYVAGQTLGQWLREMKPGWRAIVGAFVQAGRGLAAAHEAEIVHRDFKPANVLIDARGRVRVVDFGVAQVRSTGEPGTPSPLPVPAIELADGSEVSPPTPSTPLTEAGSLVGTPAYMSPEQHRSATVDARSDQFSFCVAMYEALFGKRPFTGRGKTLAEQIKNGIIQKPDAKTSVPGWVTAIVLRGLAVEPERRFPSMSALVEALERDPGKRRRRIAVTAGVLAVLAGGAALAGWRLHTGTQDAACSGGDQHLRGVWDEATRDALEHAFAATGAVYAESSAHRTEAVLEGYRVEWLAMREDACHATRVRREQSEHVLDLRTACLDRRLDEMRALTTLLSGPVDAKTVEHAVDAASALAPIRHCADVAALLQPDGEPTDPAARAKRGELRDRLDRLRVAQRTGHSRSQLEAVRSLAADARSAGDAPILAEALELQGIIEVDAGDLKAAEATLAEALRRARELGNADLFATSAIDLVDALGEGGISTSREALGVVRVAEAVVDDTDDPAIPVRLGYEKADEYMTLAHPDLALPILQESAERGRRTLGEDHVLTLQVAGLVAGALSRVGKPADARTAYDKVIATETRVLGALHPMTLKTQLGRCHTYLDADALADTASCYARVLPDATRALGARDRERLSFVAEYAFVLVRLGRDGDARTVYAQAYRDVPDDAWSEKFFIASEIALGLGRLDSDAGDYQAALEHCQRGVAATEDKHAGPGGATCVGDALLGLGKPDQALAVLEPMAARLEKMDPMQLDPVQVAAWRFAYARALWEARHQAAPARAAAQQARGELPAGALRDRLDAWLAKLPR